MSAQSTAVSPARRAIRSDGPPTGGRSSRNQYTPPPYGPDFNVRLLQDLKARRRGDPRLQIALFLKHAVTDSEHENERGHRFQIGEVLQGAVTSLLRCGVRLQDLADLSPKNALTLVRYWRQQGEAEGTVFWRAALLRDYLHLIGRNAPLLQPSALQQS